MKNTMLFVGFLLFALWSCKSSQKNSINDNINFSYPKTILPQDTTKLWVAEGEPSKQIVAIFLQGGPKDELNFEKSGKSSWRYLPDYEQYYHIHLHQANTLNTDIFRYEGEFTMEMARKEVDNTSEILSRAVKYFKERGKTVWVFGHSYGAFIIPHYLATRPSLADKYVIVSGRIEDPKEVVATHERGFNGLYKGGNTFISDEGIEDFSEYNEAAIKYYTGKQRLKAAIGEIVYSDALKNIDLNHSVYVYNAKDDRVGGLTIKELEFLRTKGFQVYETQHEHGYSIYGLVDGIKAGTIQL